MIKIGKREIGKGKSTYIVAEAGINHNGDLKIAKEMITVAALIKADAIKFQTIFPEELFSKKLNPDLYSLIKQWSFTKQQHIELQKIAKKNNIDFFSTPVGTKSAKLLKDIKVQCIKIPSGELTNHELIKMVSKMKIPMIISTGMSTMSEIISTVEIVQNEKCPFVLLHCNASYPSPLKDCNLSTIQYFQSIFNVPIGYSDHVVGDEACLAAVAMGASIIEKHFTLNKNMDGPDQKNSADPKEFKNMVLKIRNIEKLIGKIRNSPTKSEEKFRKIMRKSVGASQNIPKGTKIKRTMLSTFRPGTGISVSLIENIIGLTTKQVIKKDEMIKWEFF